jgi:hypothetical protein
MIPRPQFDTLLDEIKRAIGCATIGGLVAGYDLLLDGLKRAEYARLEGEEWAPPLIDRYRQAIAEYQAFYGLRFE